MTRLIIIIIIIIKKSLVTVVFCYKDIYVARSENYDYRKRVCSCPQSTSPESLTMKMQTEMRAIGKTTEMTEEAYEGLPM